MSLVDVHVPALILASASETRRALLTHAGIPFQSASHGVDEEAVKTAMLEQQASGAAIAMELAQLKARQLSIGNHDALVLGADQVLTCEGELISKASSLEDLAGQLRKLRGRPHELHSALAIARGGEVIWQYQDQARLTMRDFSDEFLADYLQACGPEILYCVGGYQLEGRGPQLFASLEGDYFTVLGLPLFPLLEFLRDQKVILQ